ncbi:MAG: inorganic pyrophosphatase [bacterium]|nr:inorganic pyrophosphatase [bacterium]
MSEPEFWQYLDQLIASSQIVIDRPQGSTHPRFPNYVYPYDYGYLDGTASGDGDGIDVWIGNLPDRQLVAVICTVDLDKRDAELKLLLGCTENEIQTIYHAHNFKNRAGHLVTRPE